MHYVSELKINFKDAYFNFIDLFLKYEIYTDYVFRFCVFMDEQTEVQRGDWVTC